MFSKDAVDIFMPKINDEGKCMWLPIIKLGFEKD